MVRFLATTALAAGLFAPGTGSAQQAETAVPPTVNPADQGVGEIIVTANRRAENLQQVPISIVAFKGEALETQGIRSVVDLPQLTPGLGFTRTLVGTNAFLRGVGTTSAGYSTEVPIATYLDGLYLPNSAASSFAFNNIERIEVLKGPQGTLYGRNTTGGLINVITRDPGDETKIDTSLTLASYSTVQLNFYGSTPLSDTVAVNFSGLYDSQPEGWGKNLFTGHDVYTLEDFGFQAKLRWQIDPATKITLRGFYDKTRGSEGDAGTVFPGTVGTDGSRFAGEYNINNRFDPGANQIMYFAALKAEHKFDFATLSSLTGFIRNDSTGLQAQSPVLGQLTPGQTGVNLGGKQRARTISEEIQLTSNGHGPFQWIAGAFIYDDHTTIAASVYPTCIGNACSPGLPATLTTGKQNTRSYAGYGEGTYAFHWGTKITLGLRYTSDEKSLTGNVVSLPGFPISPPGSPIVLLAAPTVPNDLTFDKLTYKAVVAQEVSDRINVYASYNRGFKSGGFNPTTLTNPASRPEVLDDFEAGFKSELFDRMLRLNVAGFYYNYRDIQLRSTAPPAPPGGTILYNAASAHNYGADIDFVVAPARGLTINGGAEFLDAHYSSFPAGIITTPKPISAAGTGGTITTTGSLAGRQLPQAPDFSASLGVTYAFDAGFGEFELNANDGYKSSFAWEPDGRLRQAAYHLVNASITYRPPASRLSVQVFARNLNGAFYGVAAANAAGTDGFVPGAPRTFGGRVRYNF